MKLCLDLCSGLGGFSEAFLNDPNWEVIRIDINRKFKPTIQADVNFLPLREKLRPVVMLMSPDCRFFSLAYPQFPRKGIKKALELVGACLEAVIDLQPEYFCLENPKARLRWFISTPRTSLKIGAYNYHTAKKTDLWMNIPLGLVPKDLETKKGHGYSGLNTFSTVRDVPTRAKMPFDLSMAIKNSIEDQKNA